jgi:hypothetical protein
MDVTMLPSSHEASSRRNPSRQISVAKSMLDAEGVTRAALLGGAENWFDVRWCREVPEARQGRLCEAARLLWDRIAETRLRRMAWRIDLGKVFAITAENPAP